MTAGTNYRAVDADPHPVVRDEAWYAAEYEAMAYERHSEARHGLGVVHHETTSQDAREQARDADLLAQERSMF